MNEEWFKNWFSSAEYLDVYNHRDSKDADNLLKLILTNISIEKNSNILDAACGAGRHAIKLAKLGYNITAFDLSETLLNIAKNEAEQENIKVNFILADLRTFDSESKFDAVFNLFSSFGYFESDEDNFLFIKKAYNLLNKGGYYILDFLNSEYVKNKLIPHSNKKNNEKEIIENRKIVKGRVVKEIKIISNGSEHNYIESVKLYSYNELVSNFTDIGFNKVSAFGDYSGEAFNNTNSKRCIIFFQK